MSKLATKTFTVDEAIGLKVNDLMFRNDIKRKDLAAVLGISPQGMSRKVHGQVAWSVSDLFALADFFSIDVADLLPRRVDTHLENEKAPSEEGANRKKMVAGAGFEPTTSGL